MQLGASVLADLLRARTFVGKQRCLDVGDLTVAYGDLDLDVAVLGGDVLTSKLTILQRAGDLERHGSGCHTTGQREARDGAEGSPGCNASLLHHGNRKPEPLGAGASV